MKRGLLLGLILGLALAPAAQQYHSQAGRAWIKATNLTAQTGSIGTTTFFTASATGVYRISYSLDTTTAGSAGTVLLTLGWNNGAAQTVATATIVLSVLGATTCVSPATCGPMLINVTAGQNVTYATTVTAPVGSPEYSLRIRAEALQ